MTSASTSVCLLIMGCLFFSAFSCNRNKNLTPEETLVEFEKFITTEMGEEVTIMYNKVKDHAVAYNKKVVRPNNPFPTLDIKVYKVANKNLLYNTLLARGRVEWKSDEVIEFHSIPVQERRDGDVTSSYFFNVLSKAKYNE